MGPAHRFPCMARCSSSSGGTDMKTQERPKTATSEQAEWVIPTEMWPQVGMQEVPGRDGGRYLLRNDAMFTGVQHSQGEFSEFFLALRDERRIFGYRCPSCRHLIVPPFMRRCPTCNCVELPKDYLADRTLPPTTPENHILAPNR